MRLRVASLFQLLASTRVSIGNVTIQSEHCSTIKADFARRQLSEWSSESPFTSADGTTNIPVLTMTDDGTGFTMAVENGSQVASEDPATVHFVTHLYAEDQDGNVVYMQTLNPNAEGPATVTTLMPFGVTELTPYAFNNLGGLWVGETVNTGGSEETDRVITCGESESLQWGGASAYSLIADFKRRQKVTFKSDAPFTESDGVKHTPYVTFNTDSETAIVTVGSEDSELHPMIGSSDGVTEPHWITEIWVVNDQGYITSIHSMDPTGVDRAVFEFTPLEGTKNLTAYAFCNIHGLYVGPTVDVPNFAASSAEDTTSAEDPTGVAEQTKSSASWAVVSLGSVFFAALPSFFV